MIDFANVYRPEWQSFYDTTLEITSLIGIIIFPFAAFVVLYKSTPAMGTYKWMILNTMVWSFLFDLILWMYKPITLFPFYMGIATGPTEIFGSYGGFVQFEACIFIYNHHVFSLLICLLYRYSNALPIDGNYLLGKTWHILAVLGLAYAGVILYICLIILSRVDPEVLKEIVKNETTNVNHEYINSLPIFGYDATINPFIMVFLIIILLSACFVFVVATSFSIIMYRILSANASKFSPTTLKLQWMFYKALLLSLFSFLVFLISPIFFGAFIYLTGLFEVYSTPLFLFCIVFLTLHPISDYIILMYFIKPYRKFCKSCFRAIYLKLMRKSNQTVVQVVPSSVHINSIRLVHN